MGWLLDGLKSVGQKVVQNLPNLAEKAITGLANGGIMGAISNVGMSVGEMAMETFVPGVSIKPETVANEKPTPQPTVQSNSDYVLEMPKPVAASEPVSVVRNGTDGGSVIGPGFNIMEDDDYGLSEARAIVEGMVLNQILKG